jgi:DNA-binding IclR family transcriptional regulator
MAKDQKNAGADEDEARSGARRGGVQSVEVAVRVLHALAAAGGPLQLSDLAARVGMAPAKVHRYMASLTDSGIVDHRRSGSYDLGPLAAEIGMAALSRIDPVNRAADRLPALVEGTGVTGHLAVWGSNGPTVVRWERARRPLVSVLGVGSVLPVRTTATGRAFAKHLPDRVVEARLAEEAPGEPVDLAALRRDIGGLFFADASYIPGLYAVARAILDPSGQAVAAVTLVSTDRGILDDAGPIAASLRAF